MYKKLKIEKHTRFIGRNQKKDRYYIHNLKKQKNPCFFHRYSRGVVSDFFPQNPFIIWGCYVIHSFIVEYVIFINISKFLIKSQRAFEGISYNVQDFPVTKRINRYADAKAHAEQNQTAIMIIFIIVSFHTVNLVSPFFLEVRVYSLCFL